MKDNASKRDEGSFLISNFFISEENKGVLFVRTKGGGWCSPQPFLEDFLLVGEGYLNIGICYFDIL